MEKHRFMNTYRIRFFLWIAVGAIGISAADAQDRPEAARYNRRTPVVDVFEKCRSAVVNISTTRTVQTRTLGDIFDLWASPRVQNRAVRSIGSGVVIHESGYLVTNAHVISQASDVKVLFADGTELPAKIIAADPQNDLAVLKVEAKQPLAYVKLGRSDDLMIGETVVAIGNPLGLHHTVTAGIVSALNRTLEFGDDRNYTGLIQTDASINHGNSGGPLLNVNAELIGINTAIRGDAQNIGFAIPVDRLWELLPSMLDIERRERVRFGLKVSGPHARIVGVQPASPAEKAGLKPGARVLRFNNQDLRDGIDYYVHLLSQKPGNNVQLTVQQDSKTFNASVPLQAIPPPDGRKLAQQVLGVELKELSASVRQRLDLPDEIGLVVESVERNGPAARTGLQAGDILVRLDRLAASSPNDVGLTLEAVESGSRLPIEVLRVEDGQLSLLNGWIRTRGGK